MKLTDEEIIEALKAGKMIRLCGGTDKYRLDRNGDIVIDGRNNILSLNAAILRYDFEIDEPEIDWDKVIKGKYLCRFWNRGDCPSKRMHFGTLTRIDGDNFFVDQEMNYWNSCRPLRADEVKLVTDEKELWK